MLLLALLIPSLITFLNVLAVCLTFSPRDGSYMPNFKQRTSSRKVTVRFQMKKGKANLKIMFVHLLSKSKRITRSTHGSERMHRMPKRPSAFQYL